MPVIFNLFLLRGSLKCYHVLLADPLIPVKEVLIGTVLYSSDLHGAPRPVFLHRWAAAL